MCFPILSIPFSRFIVFLVVFVLIGALRVACNFRQISTSDRAATFEGSALFFLFLIIIFLFLSLTHTHTPRSNLNGKLIWRDANELFSRIFLKFDLQFLSFDRAIVWCCYRSESFRNAVCVSVSIEFHSYFFFGMEREKEDEHQWMPSWKFGKWLFTAMTVPRELAKERQTPAAILKLNKQPTQHRENGRSIGDEVDILPRLSVNPIHVYNNIYLGK